MKKEDVLTEFEEAVSEKPVQWSYIVVVLFMSVLEFVMGYLYYKMWRDYNNSDRIRESILYFSAASFMLSTAFNQVIIRYKFIRRK
jgi:hypothetical protein